MLGGGAAGGGVGGVGCLVFAFLVFFLFLKTFLGPDLRASTGDHLDYYFWASGRPRLRSGVGWVGKRMKHVFCGCFCFFI